MVSEPNEGGANTFLKVARRSVSLGPPGREEPAKASATVSSIASADEPPRTGGAGAAATGSAVTRSDASEFDQFLSGKPDDLLIDSVAFGLFSHDRKQSAADKSGATAAAGGDPGAGDLDDTVIDHWRAEARAQLSNFAHRHLHNQVDQIRRKALLDGMKNLRRGASFFDVFVPTFLAITIVVGAVLYVSTNPEAIRGLATEVWDLYLQWRF